MYFPYLRAKQFDLAALAELNDAICKSEKVIPIVEPVTDIVRVQYKRLADKRLPFILVVNPIEGKLATRVPQKKIVDILINDVFKTYGNYWLGFIIHPRTSLDEVKRFINDYPNHPHVFIHFTPFKEPNSLAKLLAADKNCQYNVFIDGLVSSGYRGNFPRTIADRVLVKDGFKKKAKNELYEEDDYFYDLHKNYHHSFEGFGDFTIIGSRYEEGGGPAYVVAIHLTDVDDNEDLIVKHFKSDVLNPPSPADPGGKFREALSRLKAHLDVATHLDTEGIDEYLDLYKSGHFPGLGVAKKVSIKHHIELVHSLI